MTSLHYNLNRLITLFLRKKVDDPLTRAVATTDSFTVDGLTNSFQTTNDSVVVVKALRVDDIPYKEFVDWDVTYGNTDEYATIQMYVTPKAGQVVEIDYDHGGSWIFPGSPHNLQVAFPAVGFKITDDTQTEI